MIKTRTQVPEIYYNNSRDFQFIGRLFDVVFNYLKTNVDTMKNNPLTKLTDDNLMDLAAYTVGFVSKREYSINDLESICNSFRDLLRRKGTEGAIKACIDMLLKSNNISEVSEVNVINVAEDGSTIPFVREIELYIPAKLNDTRLLEDMFDYILPSGYIVSMLNVSSDRPSASSEIFTRDVVKVSSPKYSTQIGVAKSDATIYVDEIKNFDDETGIVDNITVVIPGVTEEENNNE